MNVDPSEINCISLFSGAAGLDMGVELAGISRRVVVFVEREAYACEVLASRMEKGDMAPAPIWTDVSTFDGRPFRGVVECITGGFPCQDISVAGRQAGIGGERSGLWKQYLRIVSEVQPRLVIIENVAALRTNGLEVVLADLASLGFDAEWGTYRASDAGATHQRDRLFIVAHHHHHTGLHRERLTRVRSSFQEHGEAEVGGYDADGQSGEDLANAKGERRGERWPESDAQRRPELGESGAAQLAYSVGGGREQVRGGREPQLSGCEFTAPERARSEPWVADTHGSRREGYGGSDRVFEALAGAPRDGLEWPPGPDDLETWRQVIEQRADLEPSLCRVADGLAHRVDRLRLTGNGVVPRQAAEALRQLLDRVSIQY